MPSYKPSTAIDEAPTTELYVPSVLSRTSCQEHEAGYNQSCHSFESLLSNDIIHGVCNSRARKAGMTAPIRPQSLDRSLSGQPYRGQR